ncbi:hypothetical protein GEMRC1_012189 [Eukaryota sp. GEM-RC1]
MALNPAAKELFRFQLASSGSISPQNESPSFSSEIDEDLLKRSEVLLHRLSYDPSGNPLDLHAITLGSLNECSCISSTPFLSSHDPHKCDEQLVQNMAPIFNVSTSSLCSKSVQTIPAPQGSARVVNEGPIIRPLVSSRRLRR